MTKNFSINSRPIEILLVEDNPGDVRLTLEHLKECAVSNHISVVADGVEAVAFLLRRGKYENVPRPDLILLDLNLPKKDGREVLAEIKADSLLRSIPVIVFTTSTAEEDILRSYELHANCYISKPMKLEQFSKVIMAIEDFWLTVVRLPPS